MSERLQTFRGQLDRVLFPQSAPSAQGLGRVEAAVLVTALLTLAVVLELARIGWSASLDSIWAEDGQVFLHGALTSSFWHTVLSEYSGYLVVVPRLIAELASLVPIRDAAAATSILAAILVALSGLAVWVASAGHLANPYLRGALVLITVLIPVGGLESIDSASYVSWYMLFATFWLLLWRPRRDLGAGLGGAFILAAALSNPGIWFFLPLAALRAVAIRNRRDATIVAAYFLGAGAQVVAMARSSYQGVEPVWTGNIWQVLQQRVVDGAVFGLRLGGHLWIHLGSPFLIALTACLAVALLAGVVFASWGARWLAAIAIPTALVMFVVSIYQRAVATPMLWPPNAYNGNGGRYSIVPVLLVVSVGLVAIDRLRPGRHSAAARKWLSVGAVSLVAISVAVSYWAGEPAARGTPTWGSALDEAARTCASQHAGEIAVPTSPPGFSVPLPCDTVTAGSDASGQR